ncbi:hypothetical protein [Escherichia coli]|uniref:hypothetical protein n=1 Tax=Escherichia coli TaxID=562 RepID=UPI002FCD41E4
MGLHWLKLPPVAAYGRGLSLTVRLVVGGPDYTTTPVDTLILKLDGTGNNVMELDDTRSINGCFSELTVLAQSHARPRRQQKTTGCGARWISGTRTASVRTLSGRDGGNTDNGQTGIHNMKAVAHRPHRGLLPPRR